MTPRNPSIEQRIATLPITQSDREVALQYLNAGDALARLILALTHLRTPSPVFRHTVKHTH